MIYSASLDPLLEGHLAFSKELGKRAAQIKHVVSVSCMGADTNTASYDASQHASRARAGIPLMLQHIGWARRFDRRRAQRNGLAQQFLHEPSAEN